MAASNSQCLSSPSESDSDREPNSHGARIFWGNLKTPEKSRSAFVDPPQTVVRTQQALHVQSLRKSIGPSTSVQNDGPFPILLQMVEESDEPLEPAHSIMTEVAHAQEQYDATHSHFQCSSNDGNDTTNQVDASSGLLKPCEGEIEQEPDLQPSSLVEALSPLDLYSQKPSEAARRFPTYTAAAHFTETAMTAEPRGRRASELPDLISFDMPTLPQPILPELKPHTSPHSSLTPPSQLSSSSSCVTVDDLLTLSPIRSNSPLLQYQVLEAQPNHLDQEAVVSASLSPPEHEASHQQKDVSTEFVMNTAPVQTTSPTSPNSLVQEAVVAASLSTPVPEVSHQKDVSMETEGCSSEVVVNTDPVRVQTTSPFPSANDIGAPLLQLETMTSNTPHDICTAQPSTEKDGPATPGLQVLDAAASHIPQHAVISLPSTSRGETRKRSPAKGLKGKEKAHDDDNESFNNNTSSEYLSSLGNGNESASDKAAKKERRARAKREAEHRRQQLLSLSPTSADVLKLLSSPDRDSPARHIRVNEADLDFTMDPRPPNGSTPAEPETPRMNSARRVPISVPSPRRSEGSPLRFVAPVPIDINDPNRTPARRVLLPSGSQIPRPLSIDDPNRTPARRVAIQPSPIRLPEPTESLAPRIRIEESSPVKQAMSSSAKSSTQATSLNLHDKRTSSSSLSPAIGVPKPLPFPIRQNMAGGTTNATSVRTSRPTTDSRTSKLNPTSNFRRSSSISTSKFARTATKPYSRTAQGPSRLPVTSFMRGLGSIASASSASTTTNAAPTRPHASPVNLAQSRIPSPSKRPPTLVKLKDPPATASASANLNSVEDKAPVIAAYKRKRQRMISEDDPDEPPAKRAVIMVRPVIKGMYNKASTIPDASESAIIQREASPAHPVHPPGPIQVRPVIPGTLRHFETTRSSSRDLLNDSEQENNSNTQPTATKSSDSGMEPPLELREESPLVDTDTASPATTISREPTLEELPDISAPRSETLTPTESGPELRRTTRVRKPYGPDALGVSSTSRAVLRRDPMPLTRTTSMVQGEGALYPKGSSRSTTRTGMSQDGLPLNPRQLQALTDANTLRNQTYVADLQRKIVRRYGPRPGSPTTKIRTIMEKSREDRSKGREARAERRRRREQGSNMSASSESDYMDVPSSPTSDKQPSGPLTKHARGPGDEEDYETPVRPPMANRADSNRPAKTVKWDRGLARTISDWAAEQIANKACEEATAEAIRKGCLARDRTTRLDPLGNVPDANEPLEDLERERVIVTRFIYDDDVEAIRTTKKKKS